MDKALRLTNAVDENLKLVRDDDGTDTAIQLSKDKLKIVGDLDVTGTIDSPTVYAGQILGYTVIGLDETPATYDVIASMNPVHDDLKVSFVFPSSGNVEIFASIYVQTDSARPLTFGLSTQSATDGFASLGAKYENHTYMADETGMIYIGVEIQVQ